MLQTSDAVFRDLRAQLPSIQSALRERGLDGWLLYDFKGRNPVSAHLLGLGVMSRRYFVLVPAEGEPRALTHGIEQMPWQTWPWAKSVYVGWEELHAQLPALLGGAKRIALEISDNDAVPIVDIVPAGVVELLRSAGAEPTTSGDLVSLFYARWSAPDLASHRLASGVLAQVAHAAFERLARRIGANETVTEKSFRDDVLADIAAHGLLAGADCMGANGINAANPHYELVGDGATFRKGDVVLLDLWAKQDEDSIFADQTWMAYLGRTVPDRAAEIFAAARDARDAAVRFLTETWEAGRPIAGYEVDDVARRTIRERGFGDYFIHRTGHSIDRATHGMGPNIDNYETHETRTLLPGVGFSIEPGIYIPNEIGVRTEINVFITQDGPDVTTPRPQGEMLALL